MGRQRAETQREEVQTRERDQVHGPLPQVSVQLAKETQAAGDPGHGGQEMVQVTEGGWSASKQMLYKASLSLHLTSSAFSTSWWTDRVQ